MVVVVVVVNSFSETAKARLSGHLNISLRPGDAGDAGGTTAKYRRGRSRPAIVNKQSYNVAFSVYTRNR